jgi:hypothetical protein
VDVRLRDFRARFKGVTASFADSPASDRGFRLLLFLALLIAVLLTALGVWLYRRRAEKHEATRAV